MSPAHQSKIEAAEAALNRVHGDASVSRSTNRRSLEELRDHLDALIASLSHDGDDGPGED
jgi:hypothetical protein